MLRFSDVKEVGFNENATDVLTGKQVPSFSNPTKMKVCQPRGGDYRDIRHNVMHFDSCLVAFDICPPTWALVAKWH
eukprot:5615717-Amphidinium_carterae.1